MAVHDRRITRAGELASEIARPSAHPLDDPAILQLARRLVVFTPNGTQIAALMNQARKAIPGLTTAEVVQRVASHNPDCFWAIARRRRFDINAPVAEGYVAYLPLTQDGLRGLLDGNLDRRNPPLALVATQNEKPAGIYIWHMYAPGQLAAGIPLAHQKLWSPLYRDVDLYGWLINDEAVKFNEGLGFRPLPKIAGSTAPQFHVFRRSGAAAAQVQLKDHRPAAPRLAVKVARTFDDLMRAVSIRGAVYIGEQECPYEEEFDGNDFSATHLIGYVGDEPAGCMRIRYFADFAKVERLVLRKEFRSSGLARHIVRAGVELCERKGYRLVHVYAQKRLVNFWTKAGFRLPAVARELVFSDFDYVEMVCLGEPHPDAISVRTDPYTIIRPEGDWDAPGILERSVGRGVTRPSVTGAAA